MDLLQCSLEFETFPSLFNTQYDFDSRANDTLTQEKYRSDVFTIFLTVMNVFKWHKHTRSCCWSPLASVSLSLEYTFTHKYRECVSGVCFCSCVRWLKKRRAKAVCVCVCVPCRRRPLLLLRVTSHQWQTQHWEKRVSGCVLSPCICQDGAMSHLAEAASQVTSCRKTGEGNPDRAQSEWTLTFVLTAAYYSMFR